MLTTNKKQKSWKITATKTIDYDVIQITSVFNPKNELLLTTAGNKSSKRFVIIDEALYEMHIDAIINYFKTHNITCQFLPIPAQEQNKNIDIFSLICKELDSYGIKRRSEPIIVVGGGVLLDIVGFVASCYRRGISCIRVPTTLMGYIDAALGIKTGINFNGYKNRIGSFSASVLNILDRSFFKTLPKRHVVNGVGEIIKLAVIKDAELFKLLENDIVKCINDKFITTGNEILKMAIQDMLEELAPNLFEENLERLVDFGHTFSATLEMHDISNLLHGEAVAIDICLSSSLSHIKGILRMDELNKIIKLINDSFLPTFHEKITPKLMWESIKEKKLHRDGFQRLPLPVVIGKATFVNDIKYDEVCMAIDLLKNLADKLDSAKKNH